MRVGSLCSGYGGLDLAVEDVFSAETVWHCEIDAAASKVLEKRWPGVPNLYDLTAVDWGTVEPVDIMTAGYPCQPFSHAGQRKGTTDERHIWPYVREAIRRVRPRYTVVENVAGHRSLGFDRVLGDLAEDGMHVWWTSIRAADVGACHSRERVFLLVADPQGHTGRFGYGDNGLATNPSSSRLEGFNGQSCGQETRRGWLGQSARGHWGALQPADDGLAFLPTPKAADGEFGTPRTSGRPVDKSTHLGTIVTLLPTPKASDADGGKYNSAGHQDTLPGTVRLLPTPKASDGQRDDCASERDRHSPSLVAVDYYLPTPAASDATGGGRHPDARQGHCAQLIDYALLDGSQWGKYEPAIRRWEAVVGPAPSHVEPNSRGNPRLSAKFAEWMMGLPPGWVTDVDLPRTAHLKILGNGVVPQQAAAALRWLLNVSELVA